MNRKLAYGAYVYGYQNYRRLMYNPVLRVPAILQRMVHLGQRDYPLEEVRKEALEAVLLPEAEKFLREANWQQLQDFLNAIAAFLKAGPRGREDRGMALFALQAVSPVSGEQQTRLAQELSNSINIRRFDEWKSLTLRTGIAKFQNSGDVWEGIFHLACLYSSHKRFFSRFVNQIVELLNEYDFRSVQRISGLAITFVAAKQAEAEKF